ncbi:uncharacterized protein LOC128296587 [Gossypium arboreum]|uniref:uncharacterized protein LOC128296587 n=1 Tax=Gossypium arboreum TaxID=29729 RepID=UPI0022F147B9|nr:uncharacterized protein LOC128296587 [Gossypium arboreum]
MVKADPKTSVPVLIVNIRSQLRYTPSYRNAWIAKQKALEKMHGGWDASYNEVWQWCQVLERYVLGCITDLETTPAYYNDRLLRGCQVFKRLFWCFKECRDAFLYCKPLVQIGAVAQDGNERILPIAFAITPGESADDWEFFLSRLRRHVCPQPDICVISDRGTRILASIERQGYEINKDRFHEMLAVLRSVNEEGHDYLCNIPFEQWTQAYDGGLRYGQMTSNLAEGINFVLKRTHHLSITSVVRETYFHLAALFLKRAARLNQGIVGGQSRVHLTNRTCDCGRFDALRYPCAHVIAACQNLRLDPMSYVDEVYKIEYMYKVWRHVFPPVSDERMAICIICSV